MDGPGRKKGMYAYYCTTGNELGLHTVFDLHPDRRYATNA